MTTKLRNRTQLSPLINLVGVGILVASLGACSSGGASSNVTRGVATPSRFVPSRTTTPAEAARRSEWRYQSKTKFHNVY